MKLLALFLATAVAALLAGTAGAADPTPTFSGCGKAAKDSPTDGTDVASDAANPDMAEAEIEGAFINAAAPNVNLTIADLTGSVPPPALSITYNANYGVTGDLLTFVRAYLDFTGSVAYEYGHQEALPNTTRYVYDGTTTGAMFPGQHGVVQIAIPPEAGGKPGTTLKGVTAETQVGRSTVVPGAVTQSPTRGLSYSHDTAGLGNVLMGPCAGAGTAPTGTSTPPASTAPAPAPSQPAGPLPVKLASKSIKKAKKGKTVKVKLKASEPLTSVGVRIAKGSKAYGSGKLAKLSATKTVKVKLTSALKKGTYAFDVAGTDAKGARRVGSLKLKVK
jgi:hypothetical protein